MAQVRTHFDEAIRKKLQYAIESKESWTEPSMIESLEREIDFLTSLSFDCYSKAFATILSEKMYPYDDSHGSRSDTTQFILDNYYDCWYGVFSTDIRLLLRFVCSVCDPSSELRQDVADLIENGYYLYEDEICRNAVKSLVQDYPHNSSIVVLTEGSTDARFLSKALALLYPHLSEYYFFMDFGGAKSPGGVGPLVNTIKAFSGSGISNRVIAIFDNDTAARDAIRSLRQVSIPDNIAILSYPAFSFLEDCPTLGPNGLVRQDVNGMAGSIELYLGEDVLLDENGDLTPIQWTGYNKQMGAYQGEVLDKSAIHTRFEDKLGQALLSGNCGHGDWTGMHAILRSIFTAFATENET